MSVINSMISEETQKCACSPSAGITVQLEHAGAMQNMLTNFQMMLKDAVAKLNGHIHDILVDNFMEHSKHFTTPKNRQDAIIFTGIEDALHCKCWLELCLEEIKQKAT
ncbi:hypothetical protein BKA83DRAFT_4491037 [Pisolithus microcarpus]|nr:hypothetical protein BKA83DRAFT_4491037 [Pisolithus microcarpus]